MPLRRGLSLTEFFTFGFGSMVGVGWVVLMDDWLGRGGPGGAFLGFLIGGVLLLPVAVTYGRMVREVPDAGGEIAYTEGVLPRGWRFAAAWTMVLAYAIVCPWETVAFGNLLGRLFPLFRQAELYTVAGRAITAPKLTAGLALTAVIAGVNFAGIRLSGLFQNVLTFGMLALVAAFTALGLARGDAARLDPLFARPGASGALFSILMVVQIVPYFMTGFESVGKESEEARPGFDPKNFGRAILTASLAGTVFYCLVVAAVSLVFPWRALVAGKLGTEAAFERAFSSRALANLILFAALLSLVKIFNGNFVAATRMLYGIGRRGLVHPALARVNPRSGTPSAAIALMAAITAVSAFLGDSLLVPVTEVGSLAVGVGWLATCVAYLARHRDGPGRAAAAFGAAVSAAVVLMKTVPAVPGSFTAPDWIAFACWSALGAAFWLARPREQDARAS